MITFIKKATAYLFGLLYGIIINIILGTFSWGFNLVNWLWKTEDNHTPILITIFKIIVTPIVLALGLLVGFLANTLFAIYPEIDSWAGITARTSYHQGFFWAGVTIPFKMAYHFALDQREQFLALEEGENSLVGHINSLGAKPSPHGLLLTKQEIVDYQKIIEKFPEAERKSSQEKLELYEDIRCPITLGKPKIPITRVINNVPVVYDKDALIKWINTGHNTDPTTRAELKDAKFSPGYPIHIMNHITQYTTDVRRILQNQKSTVKNHKDQKPIVNNYQILYNFFSSFTSPESIALMPEQKDTTLSYALSSQSFFSQQPIKQEKIPFLENLGFAKTMAADMKQIESLISSNLTPHVKQGESLKQIYQDIYTISQNIDESTYNNTIDLADPLLILKNKIEKAIFLFPNSNDQTADQSMKPWRDKLYQMNNYIDNTIKNIAKDVKSQHPEAKHNYH